VSTCTAPRSWWGRSRDTTFGLELGPIRSHVLRWSTRLLVQRAYTNITQGELIDTYARSAFEDARRKAAKFGAMGSTIKAYKPKRRADG
jgi:hypothetical protein